MNGDMLALFSSQDFPGEYRDIVDVLTKFRLLKSHITVGGKNKSQVAGWIDSQLSDRGWIEKTSKPAFLLIITLLIPQRMRSTALKTGSLLRSNGTIKTRSLIGI
jgi:hypothetical protein